jgi:hypothetical protein
MRVGWVPDQGEREREGGRGREGERGGERGREREREGDGFVMQNKMKTVMSTI